MSPIWTIMICSIPHRDATMCELLAELDMQIPAYYPDVDVVAFRDDLVVPYGDKIGRMTAWCEGSKYVSCVDDDDMVAPDFVKKIMEALAHDPDYVGFKVRYTIDGHPSLPVEHSLKYKSWENRQDILVRDISEKNPMRRSIASLGPWAGGYAAEGRWADEIRKSDLLKTQIWIPEEMYYYQYRTTDMFNTERKPFGSCPPLPEYPWLTVIGP